MTDFCQKAKEEAASLSSAACCRRALIGAAVSFGGSRVGEGYRLQTSCEGLVRLLSAEPGARLRRGKRSAILTLPGPYSDALPEKDCCRRAFLRGLFLGCGRVNDPSRSYALEFVSRESGRAAALCLALASLGFPPTLSTRRREAVCLYRDADTVEDLLTAVGAPKSALILMNERIEKSVKNDINRRGNCDSANQDKAIAAAEADAAAIRRLCAEERFGTLPAELQTLAALRRDHPELSMRELGERLSPPLSKSALARRLARLRTYY